MSAVFEPREEPGKKLSAAFARWCISPWRPC